MVEADGTLYRSYGKVESNGESAINVLVDSVRKAAEGTPVKMDNWAARNPTCTRDIGRVLRDLAGKRDSQQSCTVRHRPLTDVLNTVKSQASDAEIPAILHFSAQEMFTKYDMAHIFARVHQPPLEVRDNLVRVDEGPKPGETIRPKDCHLSNVRLLPALSRGLCCPFADLRPLPFRFAARHRSARD